MSAFFLIVGLFLGVQLAVNVPTSVGVVDGIYRFLRPLQYLLAYSIVALLLYDLCGNFGLVVVVALPLFWLVSKYYRDPRVLEWLKFGFEISKPTLPFVAYGVTLLILSHFWNWQGIAIGVIVSIAWLAVNSDNIPWIGIFKRGRPANV